MSVILDIMPIPVGRGLYALVDGEDYERLSKFKWCYAKGYALKSAPDHYGRREFMHVFIMGTGQGKFQGQRLEVHHISGYRLDNRKQNLEILTIRKHRRLHLCRIEVAR